MDFLNYLETNMSWKILTCLEDPPDLARISSVSPAWRKFGEPTVIFIIVCGLHSCLCFLTWNLQVLFVFGFSAFPCWVECFVTIVRLKIKVVILMPLFLLLCLKKLRQLQCIRIDTNICQF